jgi:tRNA dimethylallyltransferase
MPPQIAILTGPTSVGKTDVSIDVALRLGTEIISADSMAVYRRMEVATAKPSAEQRARVPHHLVDVADPTEPFTVADYRERALAVIDRLRAAGRTPLVVGGTRLYLAALTAPFAAGPEPDEAFRAGLEAIPSEDLHRRLEGVDPEAAARLHPSDRKRIVRALEVWESTGRPLSRLQEESRGLGGLYTASWAALVRDREELYRRVNERADAMMAAGLVAEIEGFRREGLTPETPSMQGHGYKEIMRALVGDYDLEEGVRLLKRNTRRYVKYQLMWMRGMPQIRYVRADQPHERIVEDVLRAYAADGIVSAPGR